MLDINLEIKHLIYIFITALVWLGMTFWGRAQFMALYDPLPETIRTLVTISFFVGGGGILIGIGLILITIFE
jgi:hypothetical protein